MSCTHKYHLSCISKWLNKNESCPVCRKKPSEKEAVEKSSEEKIVEEPSDIYTSNYSSTTVTRTTEITSSGNTISFENQTYTQNSTEINQGDIDLVAMHLNVSKEAARKALIKHNGNIGLAIMELSDKTPFH
jgi:NACalpha-BTF3-like transcription factor